MISPTGSDLVVLFKGLKGLDSILVPGVLSHQNFEGIAMIVGTAGYCGREEEMPQFLLPEARSVYNPASQVAAKQLLAFKGEGRDVKDCYRTGFNPETFRIKSNNTNFPNLLVPEAMMSMYNKLDQIGYNLGFKSTKGPLYSSRMKIELYSSQKTVLTECGFVGVDMETGFILEGLDAVVIRAFSDMCEFGLSLPENKEKKDEMRMAAIKNSASLAMGLIGELVS